MREMLKLPEAQTRSNASNSYHSTELTGNLQMKRLHSLKLVAALALLSAASYGQTPISSLPYYITSPGAYVVTQDLSTGGIAIIINSANVTLDFNGHILTCTNPLGSTGVYVNQVRNVRIKNGTLTGF
jgi:hypothetical protein